MLEVTSITQFAKICGVTRNAVLGWIDRGLISGKALVGEGRDLKISTVEALRQLEITLDPGQSSGKGAKRAAAIDRALGKRKTGRPLAKLTVAADIKAAKLRGLKARADLAELQVGMQSGALIPITVAKDHMSEYFIAVRQAALHLITDLPNLFPYLSLRDHLAIDRIVRSQMAAFVDGAA